MIFIKWVMYGANLQEPFSEHCAPNLLITFINMMLMKTPQVDLNLKGCHANSMNYENYMYAGQEGLQVRVFEIITLYMHINKLIFSLLYSLSEF